MSAVAASDLAPLFAPIAVGGVELRNRIVMTGHGTGLAEDFKPSERHVAYYRERARGGVGLIGMAFPQIHPTSQDVRESHTRMTPPSCPACGASPTRCTSTERESSCSSATAAGRARRPSPSRRSGARRRSRVRQPRDAQGDGGRGHRGDRRGARGGSPPREGGRHGRRRDPLGLRGLPAGVVPLGLLELPRRRIRRLARESHAHRAARDRSGAHRGGTGLPRRPQPPGPRFQPARPRAPRRPGDRARDRGDRRRRLHLRQGRHLLRGQPERPGHAAPQAHLGVVGGGRQGGGLHPGDRRRTHHRAGRCAERHRQRAGRPRRDDAPADRRPGDRQQDARGARGRHPSLHRMQTRAASTGSSR